MKCSLYSDVIELKDGSFLVQNYGKYASGLGIIVSPSDPSVSMEKEFILLFSSEDSIKSEDLNISQSASVKGIRGNYFVSKKGTKLFKKDVNGKHILLRDDWGGCFNKYRGGELPRTEEGALYYRSASSNGGGLGYDYSVVPFGWRREICIEDL